MHSLVHQIFTFEIQIKKVNKKVITYFYDALFLLNTKVHVLIRKYFLIYFYLNSDVWDDCLQNIEMLFLAQLDHECSVIT
jgi:hypothetical protein